MSRSKGYKCGNIRCNSCLGKSLCTETGDAPLNCVDRIVQGERQEEDGSIQRGNVSTQEYFEKNLRGN